MNREDFMLTVTAPEKRSNFTVRVMESISAAHEPKRETIFLGLTKPALLVLAIVLFVVLPTATYAAIQWLNVKPNGISQSGRKQYAVDDKTHCAAKSVDLTHFELRKDAPIDSPLEVEKVLRAACEIQTAYELVNEKYYRQSPVPSRENTYPQYLYSLDSLGKLTTLSATKLTLHNATYPATSGPKTFSYKLNRGNKLTYFDITSGQTLQSVVPKDTVAAILKDEYMTSSGTPRSRTVVGLIRLSLSPEYYQDMQKYVMRLPACANNPKELCPDRAAIDIYPKEGGEASANPYLEQSSETSEVKQISGTVTQFDDSSLTLRSRTLHETYTVTLGEPGFKGWNERLYLPYGSDEYKLSISDEINIYYVQPKTEPDKHIAADQVMTIYLLLDGRNVKTDTPQKYNNGI